MVITASMVATLVTVGLQVSSSIINQKLNKENADLVRKMQQDSKKKAQDHSIKRDREKFLRSCEFQLKLERDSQIEKLDKIAQDFLRGFESLAHKNGLKEHYPLRVSPYIIGKSIVPTINSDLGNSRQEVFCILSNSNDKTFNHSVLPLLDELLCETIASYWTQSSQHTVCYYSQIWRDKVFVDEDIDNLKAILITPTVVITPYFENTFDNKKKLLLKINLWGDGLSLTNILDTELVFDRFQKSLNVDYIDDVISQIFPCVLCLMGHFVDIYYWSMYSQAPLLPSLLLSKKIVELPANELVSYANTYKTLFKSLVLGESGTLLKNVDEVQVELIRLCSEINLYSFPERGVDFLNSITALIKDDDEFEDVVSRTFFSFYSSRTSQSCSSFNQVDVLSLESDDMPIIKSLFTISKDAGKPSLATSFKNIISRRIITFY